jgi:hypothetical protein
MSSAEIVRLTNSVTEVDHASGPETAPVTLLEYGNFECIHGATVSENCWAGCGTFRSLTKIKVPYHAAEKLGA